MQIIYDGSTDPVCKNIIMITKDIHSMISLRYNNTYNNTYTYVGIGLIEVINFKCHLLLIYRISQELWCRCLNKNTSTFVNTIFAETFKYICYDDRMYMWHTGYKRHLMTIIESNGEHHCRVTSDFNMDRTEQILLIKSIDNYDPKLIGSHKKLLSQSPTTTKIMQLCDGFKDIKIIV